MKIGGNKKAKQFLSEQADWSDSAGLAAKYNSRAAALYRDKIATESEGEDDRQMPRDTCQGSSSTETSRKRGSFKEEREDSEFGDQEEREGSEFEDKGVPAKSETKKQGGSDEEESKKRKKEHRR